ncbi:glycosyl transferase family 2 [Prosthecochloris marina]|uniref:Glycosyl transferase family 2 n=1 Tax=Prosthecochloris marina TaxID=2017681 RepID=A0A317T3J7_9CHLB|nr:glycosyltransferase [Prosthecochloris marina]PWW81193.1 glycosyl transferase family 2 [Prosthecochloris marina]
MLSVIIPVYNAKKTIEDCLASLENQSLPKSEYEVICVDDGSIDDSLEIIKKTKKKVRYKLNILTQKNQGPAVARNNGVAVSDGHIIVFTDSDCELEKNFLEKIKLSFEDKEIAGVQGAYKTKQKSKVARFAQYEIEQRYDIYKRNKYISMMGTYAAAYKKEVFQYYGGFDTRFPIASGEDFALSSKVSSNGHKLVFNEDAICYHKHPDTISAYSKQKYSRGYWRNLLYKLYPSNIINDDYTPNTLKIQFVLLSLIMLLMMISMLFQYTAIFVMIFLLIALFFVVDYKLYKKIYKKDKAVFLLSPIFVFVRMMSIILGVVMGSSNWIVDNLSVQK